MAATRLLPGYGIGTRVTRGLACGNSPANHTCRDLRFSRHGYLGRRPGTRTADGPRPLPGADQRPRVGVGIGLGEIACRSAGARGRLRPGVDGPLAGAVGRDV